MGLFSGLFGGGGGGGSSRTPDINVNIPKPEIPYRSGGRPFIPRPDMRNYWMQSSGMPGMAMAPGADSLMNNFASGLPVTGATGGQYKSIAPNGMNFMGGNMMNMGGGDGLNLLSLLLGQGAGGGGGGGLGSLANLFNPLSFLSSIF